MTMPRLIANCLEELSTDYSGWETLYLDPHDGRYWELTHPYGEYHGGGPPRLTVISPEKAYEKYGDIDTNEIRLQLEETQLIGAWLETDRGTKADAVTQRINALVAQQLHKVATDTTGWETLYLDPHDGRYWEYTFGNPVSGGGPPNLRHLSREQARTKYGLTNG